ncbi:MAG: (NiFe) hydrogenase maturation protein HypF [Bryobacterales bacterium]|nr:(NiFe) hydrogenase maturation protein HypF [Bryobacterales bacterium]
MKSPLPGSKTRRHIHVRGIVQGVGFRPFVFKLATSLGLTGFVFNSSSGVTIEVEGSVASIRELINSLEHDPPQLASIREVTISEIETLGSSGFHILESRQEVGEFGLVSPDAGTCDACWHDFGDPANRRFAYPFTNCTHCGPRYTILQDIPYDRAKTTMSGFIMCEACKAEYRDPDDRRFHAQPNACAVCGPSLCLVRSGSSPADCSFAAKDSLPTIRTARQLLREGKILAVKGLGGFLLACNAGDEAAIGELRRRKRRPSKPFALMVRDLNGIRNICAVSPEDEAALRHVRRPIVVLPRISRGDSAAGVLPDILAPGNNTLGIMLPYTPLHYLLFSDSSESASEFPALVMTSGNLSEEPIVVSNAEALLRLSGVADWFLLHNRDIATRVDDSVVRVHEGKQTVLRRSRGFVPQSIDLGIELEQVLAVGAELKNTFCLTRGSHAILSQHIGDLENYETILFFEETLEKMKHLFKVSPRVIAHDLHPSYRSTAIALASGIERRFAVQHHHAHIASCMAEHHLRGKVIGVAMDGTGLGSDGAIWGGEFLVADYGGFARRAQLRSVPLPGGDAAVRQPWRMALSYLRDSFGSEIPDDLGCFRAVPTMQLNVVDAMLSRRIQTIQTSSCGRLFDAVAALLGLGSEVTFEGQAAIALEMAADPSVRDRYEYDLQQGEPLVVDLRQTVVAIVRDVVRGRRSNEISACFHNTLSTAIVEVCCRIRKSDGLDRVCLSGGVFQNHLLLGLTAAQLRRLGFGVFLHAMVPANDGGISLGQAVIANELLRQRG